MRFENGLRVPRDFSAMIALDENDLATGEVSSPRPMTQMQMEAYTPLTELPVGVVNEAVTLPQGKYIRPGAGDGGI